MHREDLREQKQIKILAAMRTGTDRILCRFCYCPSRGAQSISLLPGFCVQGVAEIRLITKMTKLLKSSVYAGFNIFLLRRNRKAY